MPISAWKMIWTGVLLFVSFTAVPAAGGDQNGTVGGLADGLFGADSGGIEPGVWSIAGASWNLQVAGVPKDQLQPRLNATPQAESYDGLGMEHVALFEAIRGQFQLQGRNGKTSSYALDTSNLSVRLFCYQQGQSEIPLGAHIAYPRGKQGWTLLTVTPAASTGSIAKGDKSLLPLPKGFRRVCSRQGTDGKLQCDVIDVPYSDQQMTKFWQQQGWDIQRPDWAGLDETQWLCFRDQRCIQISSRPSLQGRGTAWVMVTADAATKQVR